MALTKISTDGVKDDAITKAKIPADQIEASELANNAVDTNAIADQAVTLDKLPHGDSNNNGKFLRANNGADPSFEDVPAGGISDVVSDTSPQLGGNLASNGNNIDMADNDRIQLGTGTDFEIYHKSADNGNYIESQNSRNLFLEQNQIFVLDETGNEYMIHAVASGAVSLYHANTKQCETSASGLAFPSGKGIDFSATSGTGTSELFDDYEEGTFTPDFNAGSSASACYAGGVSYSSQVGVYRKVGHVVHFIIKIQVSSGTLKSGILQINSLPFTSGDFSSFSTAGGASYGYTTGYFSDTANLPTMFVSPGQAFIQFFNTAGNNFAGTHLAQAAGRFDIHGHYFTS